MRQLSNAVIRIVRSEMEVSKEEKRGVVRFLTAEGLGGMDIHQRMSQAYSEHCMFLSRVKTWHKCSGKDRCH